MRIEIPKYAKNLAKKALEERKELPKSKKFGLDKKQASKLKINSGVERAKQLINNKYIKGEDAKSLARFYSRFKNAKTKKEVGALNLWGGKRFGKKVYNEVYNE